MAGNCREIEGEGGGACGGEAAYDLSCTSHDVFSALSLLGFRFRAWALGFVVGL